jgi:hypothetical protein
MCSTRATTTMGLLQQMYGFLALFQIVISVLKKFQISTLQQNLYLGYRLTALEIGLSGSIYIYIYIPLSLSISLRSWTGAKFIWNSLVSTLNFHQRPLQLH